MYYSCLLITVSSSKLQTIIQTFKNKKDRLCWNCHWVSSPENLTMLDLASLSKARTSILRLREMLILTNSTFKLSMSRRVCSDQAGSFSWMLPVTKKFNSLSQYLLFYIWKNLILWKVVHKVYYLQNSTLNPTSRFKNLKMP